MNRNKDVTGPTDNSTPVYVLPTRYGFLFMLVLLAMLIGSMNYGSNLGFVLTFLLGAMALVSLFHTCRNISRIVLLSMRARPVFAGGQAVFNCRLKGGPKTALAVRVGLSGARKNAATIPVHGSANLSLPTRAEKRGIMESGPLTVSSRYPMGLFRAWKRIPGGAQCLVYPRPMPGQVDITGETADNISGGRAITTGVDDFLGLKAYQPGDSIGHISWKAFSRGQGLFTKQFAGRAGSFGILDWDQIAETDEEKKLSLLCGMVLRAHRDRITYGLRIPGRAISPGLGDAHRQNCLKALALHRISPDPVQVTGSNSSP